MASGEQFIVSDIHYQIISKNAIQVGYGDSSLNEPTAVSIDYSKDINIPSFIEYRSCNYSVKIISAHAFLYCTKIQKITIPFTIEELQFSCFNGMTSLEEIIIAPGTILKSIGVDFIAETKLKYFFIPSTVKIINEYAFRHTQNVIFYYCGHRRFSQSFDLTDPPSNIHVPYNYRYATFGNIAVVYDSICDSSSCTIIHQKKTFSMMNTVFVFLITV